MTADAAGRDVPGGGTLAWTLTLNWTGTSWVTVPSADAATGFSVLNSVSTTPGAIAQAVGFGGSSGAENPLAEQNG